MAEKITWTDLFELDDTTPVDVVIKKIGDFQSALENVTKGMQEQQQQLSAEYQKVQKDSEALLKSTTALNSAYGEQAVDLETLTDQVTELAEEDEALMAAQKDNARVIGELTKASEKLSTSQKKLMDGTADQAEVMNEVKDAVGDVASEYGQLESKASKSQKKVDELSKKVDKSSGSFKKAEKESKNASKSVEKFDKEIDKTSKSTDQFGDTVNDLDGEFGGLIGGIKSATAASKAFVATPLGIVLAGIALALASVAAFFKTTNEGEDELAETTAFLSQLFRSLQKLLVPLGKALVAVIKEPSAIFEGFGKLLETIKSGLIQVFQDPIGAIKELGDLLVSQIIVRFEAIGIAGRAIAKVFRGDFAGAVKDATDAQIQLVTGVENGTDKISDAIDGITESVEGFIDGLSKAGNAAVVLTRRADALNSARIKNIVDSANTQLKFNKLLLDSENKLLFTDQERLTFLIDANSTIEKQLETDIKLAKERLAITDAQIKLDSDDPTDERLEERANLEAELIKLQADFFSKQKEGQAKQVALEIEIANEAEARRVQRLNAELDLQQAITEGQIRANESILRDQELTGDEISSLLQENAEKRLDILNISNTKANEAALAAARARIQAEGKIVTDELLAQDETLALEREKIQEQYARSVIDINESLINALKDNVFTSLAKDLMNLTNQIKTETDQQIIDLSTAFQEGNISAGKFLATREKVLAESTRSQLLTQLDALEAQRQAAEEFGMDTLDLERQIADTRVSIEEQTNAELLAKKQFFQEQTVALAQQGVQTIFDGAAQAFEVQDEALAARREKLEEEYALDTALAGDNAEQKAAIDEKFANEERKLRQAEAEQQRKKAVFDKTTAATQIIIQTALAVGKSIAASPLTGGLPFSAIVGALGAAQLALVLARPIPAFAEGTSSSPEGYALVGEAGAEIIRYNGQDRIVSGPSIEYLKQGSQVFTAEESQKMLDGGWFTSNSANIAAGVAGNPSTTGIAEFTAKVDELQNTIKGKKELHINITDKGIAKVIRDGHTWTTYLNQHYK